MTAARDVKGALAALRATRTRLSRAREWARYARALDLEAELLTRLQALADEEQVLVALAAKVTAAHDAWARKVKRTVEAAA